MDKNKLPLRLIVNYDRALKFRELVEQIKDCKVRNVIEIKTCEVLEYWIDCPEEQEEKITDMAFMTWITNPEFQKYY
jgi:hypothetical protein